MYALEVEKPKIKSDQEILIEYRKAEIEKTIREIDEGRCKMYSSEEFWQEIDQFVESLPDED